MPLIVIGNEKRKTANHRHYSESANSVGPVSRNVLGDCVAENRGADYVEHRTPIIQTSFAWSAHGAGQRRDYAFCPHTE